ncbi:MAG: hypothetical protein A2138_26555 [Deltaproteobacteria bacterium RBG_16_71_12]|nr:MAG: hypothetical protein A2138_26555 [Deltaproteobacteria bacterium RBG_16_71_12]
MRSRGTQLAAACALALAPAACPAEQPIYDDDIGVQAIPAPAGSHAGTFALKTRNQTLVHVPVLGDYEGGGDNFRLVTRSWDEAAGLYHQESTLCGGYNFEVAGVVTEAPRSTYRAVPPSTAEEVVIDHEAGTYLATGHLQLWALRELPDPYTTTLPTTKEEAAVPPWDERIYDMDGDDNPAMTLFVSGAVEGEVYAFQRKTVDLDGVILGPDRAVGLAHNTNEALTVAANNPLVDRQSEGSSEPHPDPKRSFFEEVRIAEGADCDDVIAASEDGTLSELPPF